MTTRRTIALVTLLCLGMANELLAQSGENSPWWLQPHRLLQTNLREIDATMDLDKYVQEVKQFGADVVLFNVGGIVANYPTDLEFHWRNTNMEGDLVGAVLPRLHEQGLRMIGRFDFSKINEKFAAQHPEWLYVSETGENVNYNGQVHTCVSGGYQQEYMFKILGEAIDRYPLDGVFFNMIGFTRNDYSGNYHGVCQCENCKRRFNEYSGLELPPTQNNDDPTYKKYVEFTNMMKDRQFRRVNAFLKGKRPDLAICTYTSSGVDVIRKESNRALGQGTYHDTDKAKWTMLTCGERQLANAAVHFIRIPFRHAAVSPYLTTRRLWQQVVNGAWLDFYCIGPLQRQEDRTGLDLAEGIYRFHDKNRRWLVTTRPAGNVGLVRRGGEEYEGILRILAENQVAFELVELEADQLDSVSLVVIPEAGGLAASETAVLDAYVKRGGRVLLTKEIPERLECLSSAKLLDSRPAELGSYVRIRPEDKLVMAAPILEKLDLVFLNGTFLVYEAGADVDGMLRLIPQDMFGPPEKCYYRNVSDHPALLRRSFGEGAVACFPFGIGEHYSKQAHQGHAALLMGAIDQVLQADRRLLVTASPLVEINHRADVDGQFEWVSLYNHSGQRGIALHKPIPIPGVSLSLAADQRLKSVQLLESGRKAKWKVEDGRIHVTLPPLEHYEIVLFEYEPQ